MVRFSSAFTPRLDEAICLLWRGALQFSLISPQVQDQASFSAITKMRDVRGERGTPVEPAPQKPSQRAGEGIPSYWLDAGRAAWKPEIPPPHNGTLFFFFLHVYFLTALPSAIQHWHNHFLPAISYHEEDDSVYVPRNNSMLKKKKKRLFGGVRKKENTQMCHNHLKEF